MVIAAVAGTAPEITMAVLAPRFSANQPMTGPPIACPPTRTITQKAMTRPRMARFDDSCIIVSLAVV